MILVPIGRHLGLYATDWSPTATRQGVERFAPLFANVFRQINTEDAGLILHHWSVVCRGNPCVELVGHDEYLSDWLKPAAAWVTAAGHVMRFRRHYMHDWSDGLVSAVIGHELGHIHAAARELNFTTEEKSERYADLCASLWGFAPGSNGEIDPEPEPLAPTKKNKIKKRKKERFAYDYF